MTPFSGPISSRNIRALVTAATVAVCSGIVGVLYYQRINSVPDEEYPLSGLSDDQLRKRISAQQEKAKKCGSLVAVPTTEQAVEGGWVRVAENLKWKPKGSSAIKRNPFLPPYEPGLCIGDLAETGHRLLLNKYAVMPGHLLVVTKLYFNQNDSLTWADFKAVHRVLQALGDRAVAFFNHGPESGFSQKHRHIQIIPDVEYPLKAAYKEGAQVGFKYATRPQASIEAVDSALKELGLSWSPNSSFNMLWTLDGPLVVIPRSRDATKDGGVGVNGIGFTGSLFVKSQAQLSVVKQQTILGVLREVGVRAKL
ncbi:bifunctional AP-4-A phosphorylase/ADP sulfurylase [Perkinsus olseni]|uniref:Bifunctional AP-4-A phosphorylase/ADP sulfurylase n=1 Tax=Perkinsus olseni TaxID=32597 RepID=A0A7J6P5M1_PEROL|nr:bifunctional AP-4-A phosphorylase/ADP sulfurylase [Perkinsus olseni]